MEYLSRYGILMEYLSRYGILMEYLSRYGILMEYLPRPLHYNTLLYGILINIP